MAIESRHLVAIRHLTFAARRGYYSWHLTAQNKNGPWFPKKRASGPVSARRFNESNMFWDAHYFVWQLRGKSLLISTTKRWINSWCKLLFMCERRYASRNSWHALSVNNCDAKFRVGRRLYLSSLYFQHDRGRNYEAFYVSIKLWQLSFPYLFCLYRY